MTGANGIVYGSELNDAGKKAVKAYIWRLALTYVLGAGLASGGTVIGIFLWGKDQGKSVAITDFETKGGLAIAKLQADQEKMKITSAEEYTKAREEITRERILLAKQATVLDESTKATEFKRAQLQKLLDDLEVELQTYKLTIKGLDVALKSAKGGELDAAIKKAVDTLVALPWEKRLKDLETARALQNTDSSATSSKLDNLVTESKLQFPFGNSVSGNYYQLDYVATFSGRDIYVLHVKNIVLVCITVPDATAPILRIGYQISRDQFRFHREAGHLPTMIEEMRLIEKDGKVQELRFSSNTVDKYATWLPCIPKSRELNTSGK